MKYKNYEAFGFLLQNCTKKSAEGINIAERDQKGRTIFEKALEKRDFTATNLLLDYFISDNFSDSNSQNCSYKDFDFENKKLFLESLKPLLSKAFNGESAQSLLNKINAAAKSLDIPSESASPSGSMSPSDTTVRVTYLENGEIEIEI